MRNQGADTITFVPTNVHCQSNCEGAEPYAETITVRFSRKVLSLVVVTDGPFLCSGSLPTVRAYDATGRQVAQTTLSIDDPPDCALGNDDVSWGQTGYITATTPISYLQISPGSPWTFAMPSGLIGRMRLEYAVGVLSAAPAEPPCDFTGDTLLAQSPVLRQALTQALQTSRWSDPNHSNRKESLKIVVRDQSGALSARDLELTAANICQMILSDAALHALNGADVVGVIHPHPLTPGETYPCTDLTTGQTKSEVYDPLGSALNSHADAELVKQTNQIRRLLDRPFIDFWYIDSRNVYRIPGSDSYAQTLRRDTRPVSHHGCRF